MNSMIKLNIEEFEHHYKRIIRHFRFADANELMLKAIEFVRHCNEIDTWKTREDLQSAVEKYETAQSTFLYNRKYNLLSQNLNDDIRELIDYLAYCKSTGILIKENCIALVKYILKNAPDHKTIIFDDSVYQLCNQLYDTVGNGSVYIPFESNFYHSVMLGVQQPVYAEGVQHSKVPLLINRILGNLEYRESKAVENPAYVEEGFLQKFSKGFLVDPWGKKINFNEQTVERFGAMGNSHQNYLIQHLFQQVEDFAIVAVPINFLTSAVQGEQNMRKWLLEQKHLKAVVSLPTKMIRYSSIASALLIFDFKNQFDGVRFLSLANSEFVLKLNRETSLQNLDRLIDVINGTVEHSVAKFVDYNSIIRTNYVLHPERYILDNEAQQAVALLQKYETQKLGNLVKIIRPESASLLRGSGDETIFEIQGGDLPDFGYIEVASKESFISSDVFNHIESSFLQEGDIIITVRGTVGKVGIVSQALLDKYDGRVIVGQTSLVLRVSYTDKISPIALLMQLRSKLTQARLQPLAVGAVTAGLSLKDLKEFPVVLFSKEKQQELLNRFLEQVKIKQSIIAQQIQIDELGNDFWE